MIDFHQSKTRITKPSFVLYKKPDKIKVVGYFRKMIICILLKTLRKLVLFCSFEGSQKILIPFDQSVKWSALLTSGETRNSDFAKSENKQDQEYFESLVQRN
jgi:isochorismate synthase